VADKPLQQETKIREFVQPYLDAEILNAVSIGVVHGDQTWIGHFGQLSSQHANPPNDQTIYEIGSISKVFTGLLLAHAVETGQLKLEQPVGSLMNTLETTNADVGTSITLLHLSTHNSGLPRMPNNWKPADPKDPYVDYDRELLTAFMSKVKPGKKPNEATAYSNVGVGLLGDLLAAKSGVSYGELLSRTISEPLKMSDTTVKLSDEQLKRVAPPHNAALEAEQLWEFDALAGAGAIRSTVPDMLKFIQAILVPPKTELGKAVDLAWQQHVPSRNGYFAMSLGWHIARDGSTRWHNGQTGGYHSMMLVNRPLQSGVIVLSNTATGEVDAIGESIIQMLAGMDVKPREFSKAKQVSPESMKRLAGKYKLFPNFILDVRVQGDRLMVQATNQPAIQVYAESETRWQYRVVKAAITFELPEQGPATALTLHQNGRDMRGPRIDE
jgi:CubicO group peptidase (beta-lactamase class C family)